MRDVNEDMGKTDRIPVASGEHVAVVHHEAATDRWIVFCHGFVSDKSGSYEGRCQRAVEEGYNAVRFDFRGCGDSDGQFVEQTLSSRLADLQTVIEQFAPPSLVLFGSSFGGKVAFHHATGSARVEAIVGRAPVTYNRSFDEWRAVVENGGSKEVAPGFRIDRRFFDDLDEYGFEAVTSTLDVPVAIFHGGADPAVPIEHSFDVADELGVDAFVQKYAGEKHRFSQGVEERMRRQMFDWLSTI
jgi:pimeloyl-ACP methyl ester carboxylesterase